MTIDDLAALDRLGVDRHDLAVRSANLILSEVFEHGFYHADPHPGNFLVLADGAIGALDFGMVGHIENDAKLDLLELMVAVVDTTPSGRSTPSRRSASLGSRGAHVVMRSRETWPTCSIAMLAGRWRHCG